MRSDSQEKEIEKIQPRLDHIEDNYPGYFEKSKSGDVSITRQEYPAIVVASNEQKEYDKSIWDKIKDK